MHNRSDLSQLPDFDFDLASSHSRGIGGSEQPVTRAPGASAPLLAHAPFPGVSSDHIFGPAFMANGAAPDIQLFTADNGHFYAHRGFLQFASTNAFGGLLAGRDESIVVPETSAVLLILLHVVYELSCPHHAKTTLETVESVINALSKYGFSVQGRFAAPRSPLFQLILSKAPYYPIDAYALAAHHQLEDLAVAISAHLLAYNLSSLTDVLSLKMGPVYLRRLFNLQQARRNALKQILMRPPAKHRPNLVCDGDQGQLTHAWAFAAAEMAWDVPPTTSTYGMQSAIERAGRDISCAECRAMLNNRIREATQEWSAVQRTI